MDRRKNGTLRLPCVSWGSETQGSELTGQQRARGPGARGSIYSRRQNPNHDQLQPSDHMVVGFYRGERRQRGVYDTYNFGDADSVQKSGQIICEFLQGIIRGCRRLIRLTVSEHIGCDYTITRLNPWADLVPPAVPIRLSIGGLSILSVSIRHTRDREIHVPRVG